MMREDPTAIPQPPRTDDEYSEVDQARLAKKIDSQYLANKALAGPAGDTWNEVLREMGFEEW